MGADLWIPKLQKPLKEKREKAFYDAVKRRDDLPDDSPLRKLAQEEVNAAHDLLNDLLYYFRDSYNGTSVMWRLGLSWRQDVEYDEEKDDDEINVSPVLCQKLLAKIKSATLKLPESELELHEMGCKVDSGGNSLESWRDHFSKKRERLIAFLERAIENGGMYASC